MAKSKEIAKKKEGMMAVGDNMPDYVNAESARGQENVTADDLSIPRLSVIQALSPQRKKTNPEYIEGAEEGMLFNTVSNALYGDAVQFVPCFFRKEWVIWKSRLSGGGFGGAFGTEAEASAHMDSEGWTGKTVTDKGVDYPEYEIHETAQHFGLIITEDGMEEVVASMSKSKLKASRQLNTLAKMAKGDRFASAYELSAVEVNGDRGDYYNLSVKRLGYVSEEVFRRGEALYDAVSAGNKDVSRKADGVVDSDSETAGGEEKF